MFSCRIFSGNATLMNAILVLAIICLSSISGLSINKNNTRRFDPNFENVNQSRLLYAERRSPIDAFGLGPRNLENLELSQQCLNAFEAMEGIPKDSELYLEHMKLIASWGTPDLKWFEGLFAWLGSPEVCSSMKLNITSGTDASVVVTGLNGILEIEISFNKGVPFNFAWEVCLPSQCQYNDFVKIGNSRLAATLLNNRVFQTLLMEGQVKNVMFLNSFETQMMSKDKVRQTPGNFKGPSERREASVVVAEKDDANPNVPNENIFNIPNGRENDGNVENGIVTKVIKSQMLSKDRVRQTPDGFHEKTSSERPETGVVGAENDDKDPNVPNGDTVNHLNGDNSVDIIIE